MQGEADKEADASNQAKASELTVLSSTGAQVSWRFPSCVLEVSGGLAVSEEGFWANRVRCLRWRYLRRLRTPMHGRVFVVPLSLACRTRSRMRLH